MRLAVTMPMQLILMTLEYIHVVTIIHNIIISIIIIIVATDSILIR